MERGGDWKHLTPLCYGWMNDGMGVCSCGLDTEVWEGETLFTSINLTLWKVEVCSPRCTLFFWVNLCLFVWLTASPSLCYFVFSHLMVVVFLTFSLIHQPSLCFYLSLPSGVCLSFCHTNSPLLFCFKRCNGE